MIALAIGAVVAWFIAFPKGKQYVENKFEQLGKDAKKIIEDAEKEGQAQKRDLIKEAKAEISELKAKADKDIETKKSKYSLPKTKPAHEVTDEKVITLLKTFIISVESAKIAVSPPCSLISLGDKNLLVLNAL